MGAWGHGILQNDTAQDGLVAVGDRLIELLAEFADTPGVDWAAKAGAAVGLLLQFSPHAFDPESPDHPVLIKTLTACKPHFSELPGKAGSILEAILKGLGPDEH
jgi:hypothetical protein